MRRLHRVKMHRRELGTALQINIVYVAVRECDRCHRQWIVEWLLLGAHLHIDGKCVLFVIAQSLEFIVSIDLMIVQATWNRIDELKVRLAFSQECRESIELVESDRIAL